VGRGGHRAGRDDPGRGHRDEHRVILAVEADSEDDVRSTLARDPWSKSHLVVSSVEPWTIRLDGRAR
jgi:hypothetical protein